MGMKTRALHRSGYTNFSQTIWFPDLGVFDEYIVETKLSEINDETESQYEVVDFGETWKNWLAIDEDEKGK